MQKPFMLIVGEEEEKNGTISIRHRKEKETSALRLKSLLR
jgi:threonyl-tRNA synthetase